MSCPVGNIGQENLRGVDSRISETMLKILFLKGTAACDVRPQRLCHNQDHAV